MSQNVDLREACDEGFRVGHREARANKRSTENRQRAQSHSAQSLPGR